MATKQRRDYAAILRDAITSFLEQKYLVTMRDDWLWQTRQAHRFVAYDTLVRETIEPTL